MKVRIEIPDTLNDISLSQYQEFQKVLKANEGQEDSTFVSMKMLQIFCNIPIDTLNKVPIEAFSLASEELAKVLEAKPRHRLRIKIGGQEFGFIPKLEDITLGEYVDLENYLKDSSTFHKALAVMYRPITMKVRDTYEIEPYDGADKYADYMKEMGLSDALGALLFFWRLAEELLNATIASLEGELMETITASVHNSEVNGDGINPLTTLQTEILQTLTASRNYLYTNVCLN